MRINLGTVLEPCNVRTRIAASDAKESYFVPQDVFQIEMRRQQYLGSLKKLNNIYDFNS